MNEDVWNSVKEMLVEGINDAEKENMEKVFDLIHDQTNDPTELKVMLPIARHVYPSLRKTLEPKEFVDMFSKKILFEKESSIVKRESTETEVELMVNLSQLILNQFNK